MWGKRSFGDMDKEILGRPDRKYRDTNVLQPGEPTITGFLG